MRTRSALPPHHEPIAIVLDLVHPAVADRRRLDERRKAGLDESRGRMHFVTGTPTHDAHLANRSKEAESKLGGGETILPLARSSALQGVSAMNRITQHLRQALVNTGHPD